MESILKISYLGRYIQIIHTTQIDFKKYLFIFEVLVLLKPTR
jgi:hypothetical protein